MLAGGAVSLVVVELVGLAVLALVCRQPGRWTVPARLGLAFGLGLILLTVGLFDLSLLGFVPSPRLGLAILSAVVVAAATFRGPRGRLRRLLTREDPPDAGRESRRRLAIAAAALLVGLCAVAGAASLLEPVVEWDVLAIWALKGKVLLHEPIRSSPYFHDATKAYSHLDYPLLWPMAMAWTWCCARGDDLQVVKFLAPALLAALAAAAYGFFGRETSRPEALLLSAVVVGSPMVLSQTSRLLADAPLAYFVLGAFACCHLWLESGHPDDLRLAAVFAAGMLFTKNEGVAFFAALLASASLVLLAHRRWRAFPSLATWFLGVPLALTAPWFVFRSGIPKLHEDYGSRIHPAYFLENASRIPSILVGSLRYFADFDDWLILWPALAVVLILTANRWAREASLFLVLSLGSVLALYGYIYVVSPWNVETLMATTAARLLLQLAPLGVFVLAACARSADWLPGAGGEGESR